MSESLQARWPEPEADLGVHRRHLEEGIRVIHSALIVPGDERFESAYTLLVAGRGQKSSVLAEGDPSSGKTSFGDLMFGVESRVEIDRTDTETDLYGYENPIKEGDMRRGKLVGLEPYNPTAYLNEASHLRDTGPLHRIWDAETIKAHGHVVPMANVAIYLTSNYPDGSPRVKEFDAAFRSRLTMKLLTGDGDNQTARQIQGYNAVKDKRTTASPILPVASVRKSISDRVAAHYPVPERGSKTGDFVVDLITQLNHTNLLTQVNPLDARTGEALHDTARARMWLRGEKDGTAVAPRHIAEAAALVLPTVADLSYIARNKLKDTIGRRASDLEQAVAIRRVIAQVAFQTLFEDEVVSPGELRRATDKAVEKYSYANPAIVPFDIDQALYGGKPVEEPNLQGNKHGLRGYISRRFR